MVLGPDCVGWMDAPPVDDTVNWTRDGDVIAGQEMDPKGQAADMSMSMSMSMPMPMSMPCSFSSFKSMLDGDASWYLNPTPPPPPLHDLSGHLHHNPHAFKDITFCPNPEITDNTNTSNNNSMFFDPSSCSSSPATAFLNQQPFVGFDLAPEPLQYLPPYQPPPPQLNPSSSNNPGLSSGAAGFGFHGGMDGPSNSNSNALFFNRPKVLRPLEVMPQTGSQPTLFQKRAAKLGNLEISGEKRKRVVEDGDLDDDLSGINYDSDDGIEFSGQMGIGEKNDAAAGGYNSVADSGVTAGEGSDPKGKKKGMPAKNLMAERRRRKKLNDRLYMLRSVVPKISKMDRASILGDAIDYLKELLQRISNLHNELESSTPQGGQGGGVSATPASFHPLTPTLPCRVKDELGPASSLHSPKGQAARVEVRAREGRAVNIHMFCARRPGLLLSTMRTLDNLGLDIQQAVISCFNGFALDVFRAEQCRDGQDVLPEQIKALLLDSAGITNIN